MHSKRYQWVGKPIPLGCTPLFREFRRRRSSFDPVSLLSTGFDPSEVEVGLCDVAQTHVAALVIVVVDEGFDLGFEITWQDVILQQDAVLLGLMPPFDFALPPGCQLA